MLQSQVKAGACFLAIAFIVNASSAQAASLDFYTLGERWERAAGSGKTKKQAIEQSFEAGLTNLPPGAPFFPPIPDKRIVLSDTAKAQRLVEIELNQTLYIEARGVTKFVSTAEGFVAMETLDPNTLRVLGTGIGRTYLHIWDSGGRQTFELQVNQPVFRYTRQEIRERQAFEKARSFQLGYSNSDSAFYTGDKFREMARSTLDFNQNFTLDGDTPYGIFSSRVGTRKSRGKMLVSEVHGELLDARIGPYRNFNLEVADTRVKTGFMVFPEARIRGAAIEQWDDIDRLRWTGFYGREQIGLLGSLTPGLITKTTVDSFLGGGILDFKWNKQARIRGGYFTGSGRARPDNLNRYGLGLKGDLNLGPHVLLSPEVDSDGERFVQKHATTVEFDTLTIRSEFRNIDKKFVTLTGSPGFQGEIGHRLDVTASPSPPVNFTGSFDIFRDRFIPNPTEPDAFNKHTDVALNLFPWERSSLIFNFRDSDDIGRLGPTRQRAKVAQFNQVIPLLGHSATVFTRYQKKRNTVLTSSRSNYTQEQGILGFQSEIFWGMNFSVQQELNRLHESDLGRTTYPDALLYTLDFSRQIGDTPFFMDARLRIRDEEETESINSFMSGEDSTEISGGLFYRGFENMELFLTGRFEAFVPESLLITASRVEGNFTTGMRYTFDTGVYWNAVGSFEGYVFKDLNQDGRRQPEEPGIAGIRIKAGGERESVTDKNGFYQLKSLVGRKAALTIDTSKLPYGYTVTTSARKEVVVEHQRTQRVDFGVVPRSDITGIVFHDVNDNGRYDQADIGISKVKVLLETGKSTRTNSLGVYYLPNEVAGEHTVALDVSTLPEGYLPMDVPKRKITLFEGIRYELNFPLDAGRILTGRVYVDLNDNGSLDEGDVPVAGAKVTVGKAAVVTDKDGWYLFDELPEGAFELTVAEEDLPAGALRPEPAPVRISVGPVTIKKDIALQREKKS